MKIKTVALLGAGAVGSYFLWGLTEKLGKNLWVIAEGERKKQMETNGLFINGVPCPLHLKTPNEACGADLLLVATKYGALTQSLEEIAAVTQKHTLVMSLLNGIGSEELIAEKIGKEHLIYSMIKIASERKGNHITFDGPNTQGIYFGEAGSRKPTERTKAIEELFSGTPLHWFFCADIIRELWGKFALNVGYNLPQAILGVGVGAYRDSVYVKNLMERLIDEVTAVAAAKGIDIADLAEDLKTRPLLLKSAKYSTLQDLEAKRPTEIEIFAGAMRQMGKECNISTPYSDFAYLAIKALEEKNQGKFQYG